MGKHNNAIHTYTYTVTHDDNFEVDDSVDAPNGGWHCVYGNTQILPFLIRFTTQRLSCVS